MIVALIVVVFVLGVFVGREVDDTYYLARDWVKGRRPMAADRKERRRQNVLLGLLVVALASNVLVGVLLQVSRIQQGDFTRCSADYDQQFSQAYRARLAASTEATEALDRLVMAVDSRDDAEFQNALDNYVKLRTKAKATAQANPYPPLPESVCGVPR